MTEQPRNAGVKATARSMRARAKVLTISILLLDLTAACAYDSSGSGATVRRDSATVRIVESTEPIWPESTGWSVPSEPEVSIGGATGSAAYLFDEVRGVAETADGRIVVGDEGSNQIRVFGARGRHIVSLGGNGDGPGEFRRLRSFILQGDTIVAFDGALARLTTYTAAGELLQTTEIEPAPVPDHPLRMYDIVGILNEALVFVASAFPANREPTARTHWDEAPTLIYSRVGTRLGVLGEASGMDTYSTPERAGAVTFARITSAAVRHDRLYMTDGGHLEVRIYDRTGGPAEIWRILQERRPVTGQTLETYFNHMAASGQIPQESIERLRGNRPYRDFLPWISAVKVDPSGNLWIRLYQHGFSPDSERWFVIDARGVWLGEVTMPEGFSPYEITDDRILGVATDSLGVESVRLYGLAKDSPPG